MKSSALTTLRPHLAAPRWRRWLRQGRRAMVLLLVLWLVMVLSIMAYSLAYEMRLGMKMTGLGQRRLKAEAMAKAGVAKAVMDLRNDRILSVADQGQTSDTPLDIWADKEDKTDVELGEGTYTVRVVDEESKINLNMLQPNGAPALIYLLVNVSGMKEEEAQTVANAIMDFKDPDDNPTGNVGLSLKQSREAEKEDESGEAIFYTDWGLKTFGKELPEGWSFHPKNDQFMTLDELLEIPGITTAVLYGDPKHDATDPIERIDQKKPSGALADYLTVNSTGQINVNTCSLPVLEAILSTIQGGNDDVAGLARKIDELRSNDEDFRKTGAHGITNPAILPPPLDKDSGIFSLSIMSAYYTITARGEYQGVRDTVQAVVRMEMINYTLNDDRPSRRRSRRGDREGQLRSQPNLVLDPAAYVVHYSQL